jgi:threonine aldolase
VGALFGEAVVIPNPALMPDFRYHIKQRGGMLAKGRLLGIQFEVLMADGLYERLGRRAVEQAGRIRAALAEQGFGFRYDSLSNQLFPILPKAARESLGREFSFSLLQRLDDDLAVIRICTSWATTDEAVDRLIAHIKQL